MGQRLVSMLVIIVTVIGSVMNQGSFFVRYENENSISPVEENMQSVFHKSFHQCSLDEDCNFIMKKINDEEYKKAKKEKDLPASRSGYHIWRKMLLKNIRIEEAAFKKQSKQLKYLLRDQIKCENL